MIVNYVDEEGLPIARTQLDSTALRGSVYDTRDFKPTTIMFHGNKYELLRIDANDSPETGTMDDILTQVTYVYKLITATNSNTTTPNENTSTKESSYEEIPDISKKINTNEIREEEESFSLKKNKDMLNAKELPETGFVDKKYSLIVAILTSLSGIGIILNEKNSLRKDRKNKKE